MKTFHVTKEVILAAGVFNTPELLDISKEDLLKKHGITVVINSPGVGENLQDLMTGVSFEVIDGIVAYGE